MVKSASNHFTASQLGRVGTRKKMDEGGWRLAKTSFNVEGQERQERRSCGDSLAGC